MDDHPHPTRLEPKDGAWACSVCGRLVKDGEPRQAARGEYSCLEPGCDWTGVVWVACSRRCHQIIEEHLPPAPGTTRGGTA